MQKSFFVKTYRRIFLLSVISFAGSNAIGQFTQSDGVSLTGTNSPNALTINGLYVGKGINGGATSTAVGINALSQNPGSGGYNTALGYQAMMYNSTGSNNVAIGEAALSGVSLGGLLSGNVLNTGNANIAIGTNAMNRNISGSYNCAIGYNSFLRNVSGKDNVALGLACLGGYTSGDDNTAVGHYALGSDLANYSYTTNNLNNKNCAFGKSALLKLLNGSDNIAIGASALSTASEYTGSGNIAIGSGAMTSQITGSTNIVIGFNTQLNNVSASDQLKIASSIYGISINSAANSRIGIGDVPSPTTVGVYPANTVAKLHVFGTIRLSKSSLQSLATPVSKYLFVDADGMIAETTLPTAGSLSSNCSTANRLLMNTSTANTVTCSQIFDNGTGVGVGYTVVPTDPAFFNYNYNNTFYTNYTGGVSPTNYSLGAIRLHVNGNARANGIWTTSDKKFKKDIQPIKNALTAITALEGKTYMWDAAAYKDMNFDGGGHSGFIAQDLEKILPHVVVTAKNGDKAVNYIELIPYLSEGIKEQQVQIETQKIKIENLEMRITELQNKLNQLAPGDVKIKVNALEVIPNPVTGTSVVTYKLDKISEASMLIVSDLQGKIIKKYTLVKSSAEGQVKINKNEFASGMYVLSLVSGNAEIQSKKILIAE